MGLRTSWRLIPGRLRKERSESLPKPKKNAENAISIELLGSSLRPEEETSRTQPLSASLPLTMSSVVVKQTPISGIRQERRKHRFSLHRKGNNPPINHSSNVENGNCGGISTNLPKQPLSSTKTDPCMKRSGMKLLRRLSSPITLQRESGGSKDTSDESRGFHSDSEDHGLLNPLHSNHVSNLVIQRTTVIQESHPPPQLPTSSAGPSSHVLQKIAQPSPHHITSVSPKFECATAILQHSYLERICGVNGAVLDDSFEADVDDRNGRLPEDPTVQESIECIFASQLQSGLELWDDVEEEVVSTSSSSDMERRRSELVSPADLQQSRSNRTDRKHSSSFSITQTRKRYEQASLVYVGTYDPNVVQQDEAIKNTANMPNRLLEPFPCPCHCTSSPTLHPKDWPQAPILLRPTPGSNTRVKAIRFCDSTDPLWVPGSHLNWWQRLAQHWGREFSEVAPFPNCEYCAVCPVNNGNEKSGEALVIDFESDLFEGTLLLRLRFIEGTTPEPYDDTKGYFKGVNRRYQTVVRGRFKKSLPLTHMVNGFRCNRKLGKLPAKWILRGGMKVLSFFAPQLDAKLEGERPYSVTPLGSTAQSIAVDDPETILSTMERGLGEPTEAHRTLIGESSDAPTSLQRAKLRKKVFDKLFAAKSKEPMTDPSKVYTFEFLQHLFNFETFSIELGNILGSVELEEILDGQPLQIMAAYEEQPLWSFDVWHECLWRQAKANEPQ